VVVVILVDFSDCGGEISEIERVVKYLGPVGEVGLGGFWRCEAEAGRPSPYK
jgi:hypothetical protein